MRGPGRPIEKHDAMSTSIRLDTIIRLPRLVLNTFECPLLRNPPLILSTITLLSRLIPFLTLGLFPIKIDHLRMCGWIENYSDQSVGLNGIITRLQYRLRFDHAIHNRQCEDSDHSRPCRIQLHLHDCASPTMRIVMSLKANSVRDSAQACSILHEVV